jgi:Holliday junction resolvase-like predicted endonuclease
MHRERKINRRQQGDLGEASAIEWLARQGATAFTPFGHSPDVDLVAEIDHRLLRIQVKTSTCKRGGTYAAMIATNGGNQSWSGVAKFFDPARCDLLFVLVGDGRRWLIPSEVIDGKRGINLGGNKYSEFEIDRGLAIEETVYGERSPLKSGRQGEYRSGQTGGAVNALAMPSQVRILPPPFDPPSYERAAGRSGQAVIWTKRRMTIPLRAFEEAGFQIGDRVRARADGPGRIVLERTGLPAWAEPN